MKDIEQFENYSEWNKYLKYNKLIINPIGGASSEGHCYLPDLHGDVYKIFDDELEPQDYDINKLITIRDINLNSFAFPKKLFLVKNKLVGYTAKFVKRDLLAIDFESDLPYINFNKLIEAYEIMLKDVEELSKNNILMYDLSYNLLFDGKRLCGIDTCGYHRDNSVNILDTNLDIYNTAIIDELEMLLDCPDIYDETAPNINNYLKRAEKVYYKKRKK